MPVHIFNAARERPPNRGCPSNRANAPGEREKPKLGPACMNLINHMEFRYSGKNAVVQREDNDLSGKNAA